MDKIIYVLAIFFCLSVLTGRAQEIPVYNHFYNTPYLLNPAEAGIYPYTHFSLNHRQQWRGVEGAPVVSTLTFESPFDYKKWALGATIRNFNRGLLSTTDFLATYAYTVYLNSQTTLHFGLSAGLTNNSIDMSQVSDLSDPAISGFLDNNMQPISNFGIKLGTPSGFNLGVSLPRLFKPQYTNAANFELDNFSPIDEVIVMAYYKRYMESRIVTRRRGRYKRRVKIEDTYAPLQFYMLYHYSQIAGQRIEATATLNLNENIWIGGSYRLNYGASGIFGFTIKNVSFSYAYEPASKMVSGFAQGSHEVQLKINIGDKKKLERDKPKLRTIEKTDTRAPRFSWDDVQTGGEEEPEEQSKKYYVVVDEFRDFNSADRLVKKIKKDLDLNSDIFYNKSNGVYYVYVYETFSRREANKDKRAVEELTKFKNVKVIIVDM